VSAKHTTLPWVVDGKFSDYVGHLHVTSVPANVFVAEVIASDAEAEANAAFIVLAVNHHDELVEVLRAALAWHECETAPDEWIYQARNVLAKVEGKA
jgi:hypothetical protein